MANVLNLLSEETFAEKLDTQNALLATIAANNGGLTIDSWADLQSVVRRGLTSQVLNVGDKLVTTKGGQPWIHTVMDIDHDKPADKTKNHSLTLRTEYIIGGYSPNVYEALYYAETELPAGTYYFTVDYNYWVTSETGKNYHFTLTKPIPSGGFIKFGNVNYQESIDGKTVTTYSDITAEYNADDKIEEATMTEGAEGTSLNGDNLNKYMNAVNGAWHNVLLTINDWINSDKPASERGVIDSKFVYNHKIGLTANNGLLIDVDPEFLAVIGDVEKQTAINDGVNKSKIITTTQKFFLPSVAEVYGDADKLHIARDETPYAYYAQYSAVGKPNNTYDDWRIMRERASLLAKPHLLRDGTIAVPHAGEYVTAQGSIGWTSTRYSVYAVMCNII